MRKSKEGDGRKKRRGWRKRKRTKGEKKKEDVEHEVLKEEEGRGGKEKGELWEEEQEGGE